MNIPQTRRATEKELEHAKKMFGVMSASDDNIDSSSEDEITLESIIANKPDTKVVREWIKENLPLDDQ